jgi:hypothetical protein
MKVEKTDEPTSARRANCDNCDNAVRRGVAPENQEDRANAASKACHNRVGTAVLR